MLGALEGASRPDDPATSTCTAPPRARLHEVPRRRGAEGRAPRHPARYFYDKLSLPGDKEPRGG
jgi:hypothetical protein